MRPHCTRRAASFVRRTTLHARRRVVRMKNRSACMIPLRMRNPSTRGTAVRVVLMCARFRCARGIGARARNIACVRFCCVWNAAHAQFYCAWAECCPHGMLHMLLRYARGSVARAECYACNSAVRDRNVVQTEPLRSGFTVRAELLAFKTTVRMVILLWNHCARSCCTRMELRCALLT